MKHRANRFERPNPNLAFPNGLANDAAEEAACPGRAQTVGDL
jgi:hypothetical protein